MVITNGINNFHSPHCVAIFFSLESVLNICGIYLQLIIPSTSEKL